MAGPKLVLMGYEKQLFIGTAGTAAATQLLDVINIKFSVDAKYGSTTSRGLGTSVPIETSRPTSRKPKITFNALAVPANTNLVTIKAAAMAQTAISMKLIDVASGTTEFDGDVYLKPDYDAPLDKEADLAFEAEPTRDHGRDPVF